MLDLKEEYLLYTIFGHPSYETVSYDDVGRDPTLYFNALLLRMAMDCPKNVSDALIQRLGIFEEPLSLDIVAEKFQISPDRLRFAESRFLRKIMNCQKYTSEKDYLVALKDYQEQHGQHSIFERFSPFS